jgi:hypothetical protein
MTSTKRQKMISALLLDDVRIIADDLKEGDSNYLKFLLSEREPYSKWTDTEVEESYNILQQLI